MAVVYTKHFPSQKGYEARRIRQKLLWPDNSHSIMEGSNDLWLEHLLQAFSIA